MRHVDDAHDAKGDRETDRGEQQHAAETDALKQIGANADPAQPAVDRGERVARRLVEIGIDIGRVAELVEQVLHLRISGAAEGADRRQPLLLAAGEELRGGEAALHRGADLGILLGRERLFKQRYGIGRVMTQRVLGGAEPCFAIRAEQGQRPERRLDRAAQPVVHDDTVETLRREIGDWLASRGIGELRTAAARVDDHDAAVRRLAQSVAGERLQDQSGPRLAALGERDDCLFLCGKTVAAEPGDRLAQPIRPG